MADPAEAFPLRLAPVPSRRLGLVLAVAHLGAAVLLWAAAAPAWAKLAGSALLSASLGYHWLRDVRLSLPPSAIGLELIRDRNEGLRCELALRDGRQVAGRILASSVALPWLVVIGLRLDGSRRTRHLALLPDSVSEADFRALRVALRWAYTEDTWRGPGAGRRS
ncbi:MAG TPA: protein YgfX [Burkholderiales bacterium]